MTPPAEKRKKIKQPKPVPAEAAAAPKDSAVVEAPEQPESNASESATPAAQSPKETPQEMQALEEIPQEEQAPDVPRPDRGAGASRALLVFALATALLALLDGHRLAGFLERLDVPGAQASAALVRGAARFSGASLVSSAETRLLNDLTPDMTLGATADPMRVAFTDPAPLSPFPELDDSPKTAPAGRPKAAETPANVAPQDAPATEKSPEPTPPVPVLPPHKPRVLIVGDSLIMEGLGPTLLRTLRKNPGLDVSREGRYSTGLSRTDTFDWPLHLTTLIPERQPDLVVVCLGANDFQDILIDGKRNIAGTEAWNALYRERADAFLAQATALGAQVVWLGLPIMGNEQYEKRIRGISALQQAACEAVAPMCVFTDNVAVLADKQGNYLSHITDAQGRHTRLRYKDKIHVTESGGQMITDSVLPVLNDILQPQIERFTAWEAEQAKNAPANANATLPATNATLPATNATATVTNATVTNSSRSASNATIPVTIPATVPTTNATLPESHLSVTPLKQ